MGNSSLTSHFASDLLLLPPHNKASIYSLLIAKLGKFQAKTMVDYQQIRSLVTVLKELMLNHEQSLLVLNFHLKQTISTRGISSPLKGFLEDVIVAFSNEQLGQSFNIAEVTEDKLEARIPRQLESQLAIHLLHSPSPRMWESVNRVSAVIIALIDKHRDRPELFSKFLQHIHGKADHELEPTLPFAFAHFPSPKNLDDVITLLADANDLAAVMLIQFMFMRDAFLNLDIPACYYDALLMAEHGGDFKEYLNEVYSPGDYKCLAHFFLQYIAFSPGLYSDRGRAEFDSNLDNHLGLVTHVEDRRLMPTRSSYWYPDCMCQKARLESPYVVSLTCHDIPYVAGPSGMTSVFLGALALLGNFTTEQDKNYYLLAVLVYMVSGGLHSIHEVLSIPKIRLGLLPEYQVSGAKIGNYASFFSLFSEDPSVTTNIESAWFATMRWFNKIFPKACEISEIVAAGKEEALLSVGKDAPSL
ncbi:hypothetical protein [Legionella oakridgensis]|uniref:Uncharacterized protein n=2 Tax=Legionella oakridgensis TaxID=29423 RepID=W0BI84_9GAMM|nr:hypothetical protein [Legionella oakridgensis]AHE68406.1 hypothetical protein Loa_02878 [Legionella oakridgensis ATCC 33761 = DSM 21215]KTD38437.1 serine/threonine-protein kinase [Legionella oakridgensis]STY21346.1 serine/threonine-protein kinase [Legionella longbeachae]